MPELNQDKAGLRHVFTDRTGAEIEVRLAHEDDAASLIAYIKQVDGESLFHSREPGEFNMPVPTERLFVRNTNARKNGLFLVATLNGTIIGSIDFHGDSRQRLLHTGEFGMSVKRDHWGRGLGAHLLDTMIAWARGNGLTKRIKLRVQANNERAIALYRSRGFVEEGVFRREFRVRGEWVDTLLMALWLDDEP
jgi:RimJ/RimL family protein N-acetyltransferase